MFESTSREAIEDLKVGTVAWRESQIDGYLKLRDKFAKPHWDCAYDLFENEQFGFRLNPAGTHYGLVEVQPARVFGLVQQIESQVVANRPKFIADPLKARAEDLAIWGGEVTNNDWERSRSMMPELRMNVRNTILTGWGPMLSGVDTDYDAARRDRKRRHKIADQIQSDPLLGEVQAELAGEMAQGLDSVDEPKRDTTYEMHDLQWKGRVFSRAISPFQFVIDPNCASLEDAEWCGRLIIARLDQVKANPFFENTRGLKANLGLIGSPEARSSVSPEHGRWNRTFGRMMSARDLDRVILFETFERQADGTWDKVIWAKDHKKPLQVVKDCYDIGCPYRLLRWNHTSRRIFATADVQAVMTEVIEERELLTRMHDGHMRAPVDVYVADNQTITQDTDIHPLTVPGIGLVLPLPLNGRPLDSVMDLLKRNPQTGDTIAYLQVLERRFEVATGLGANQQAAALKSETSATEAAEIAKWASARGRSKYAFAEEFAAGVAQDRLGLTCQFYDEHDIAALAGPEAAKFWVKEKFTAGDIQSGLALRVEQGTMQPKDDASVAAVLKELLTYCITPQTAPIANIYINAFETMQELLRRLGIPKGSKILNQVGPDITQILAQAMSQMSQAGGAGGGSPGGGAPTPSGRAEASQLSGGAA